MVAPALKTNGATPATEIAPSDKSLAAEASSAHSRINIPLNLDNWKELDTGTQGELLWFHQWLLVNNISYDDASEAIGYERTTIYRVLKGTYEGAWGKVMAAIRSYRELEEKRGSIQKHLFAENSISKLVFAALDYALANNSMTMIVGESRVGKSISAREWQIRNNHGRSVYVSAPAVGGAKGFVRRVAAAVGVNRSQPIADMADAIHRSFNRNRILIVDQAHWLLPADIRSSNPSGLNFLHDLFDVKGCAIALLSTKRLPESFKKTDYLYEQITGRIGMPVLIPARIKHEDILPIVRQFIKNPSGQLIAAMALIANQPGRLGIMVETLKAASRIASKKGQTLGEEHVEKAIAFRRKMSGTTEVAAS